MSNTQAPNPTKVLTGQCRLSYVHLTQAFATKGGEPKFSTILLIPKSDIATKQRIDAAIQAAIQAGLSKSWNGVRPPVFGVPIYDGDGVRPSDGMPFGDECKGHWVMTASSKQRPQVVDANLNDILDASQIYSGMYARVTVNFFAYNQNGKKGIGCGLGNVQKIADGESLGGRTDAATDFGGAPANSYAQPAAPQGYAPQPVQQGYAPQGYTQQQPFNPPYPQQVQPQQPQPYNGPVDPITGRPLNGGVMGL